MAVTLPPSLHSLTRGEQYNPWGNGLGVVARRGWDAQTSELLHAANQSPVKGLQTWAQTAPLRLLAVAVQTHPMARMALSNDLGLAFAPGDTRIVAVENTADKQANPEGTSAIEALWNAMPSWMGGYQGLQCTLGTMVSVAGMVCVEAVPGKRKTGIAKVLDFSPLTLRYRDAAINGDEVRVLEQRQGNQWKTLSETTCYAAPWWGSRDNPYGVPRYSAFLAEGLADVAEQNNLAQVLRAAAWPHLAFEFPVEETMAFAKENPHVLEGQGPVDPETGQATNLTPLQYTLLVFQQFMARVESLKAQDTFFLPAGGKAQTLNAGEGLADLEPAFQNRRIRMAQALDQPSSLVNIQTGGTLAYSDTHWKLYAEKIESFRQFVLSPMVWLANLHLRLLGLPLIARAETKPIRTGDQVAEATAKEIQTRVTETLIRMGFLSEEDGSYQLTGSAVADSNRAKAYFAQSPTTGANP